MKNESIGNNFIMLVVGHKAFDCPDIAGYTPVIVGKKDFEMPSALRDDAGENISEKQSKDSATVDKTLKCHFISSWQGSVFYLS